MKDVLSNGLSSPARIRAERLQARPRLKLFVVRSLWSHFGQLRAQLLTAIRKSACPPPTRWCWRSETLLLDASYQTGAYQGNIR